MQTVGDIVKAIEDFAPLALQCDFDNCGLLYGDKAWEVTKVLVTLDTNSDVIEEAKAKGCNMIIEHHPTVFHPIKQFDLKLPLHKTLVAAIKNDIAIYSAHTSVDFAEGGLNDYVTALLGCKEVYPINGDPQKGRIGVLNEETTLAKLADCVALKLNDCHVSTVGDVNKSVRKIAVINGGGGGSEQNLWDAVDAGADIFITSELKYNVVRLAKDINYGIITFGHYDSEKAFARLISDVLQKKLQNAEIIQSESLQNPFNN